MDKQIPAAATSLDYLELLHGGIKDEESEQNGDLSPVMIQKAKWAKGVSNQGRASEALASDRDGEQVGGLAVLMPSEERSITPDQGGGEVPQEKASRRARRARPSVRTLRRRSS